MRTQTVEIFKFDELSDQAKEKAREWFRGCEDPYWHEFVYDDALQVAGILGIEIDYRERGDNARSSLRRAIYYSGFWSQGDGACFEGTWVWKACGKAIRDHAPEDTELHRIADVLTALEPGDGWSARMKHRGHYYHSGCMSVDVAFSDDVLGEDEELPQAQFSAGEETITQAMRDFADWVYRQLEKESDYQRSDEVVDENILANEYEFNSDGSLA